MLLQGENNKNMGVRSCLLASVLLCTWLAAAVCASEVETTWTGSEADLYQSVLWEPHYGHLVIARDDADSQEKYDRLKEHLVNTDVFFAQVSCGAKKESYGQVCAVLSETRYGVRSMTSDKLLAVDTPTETEEEDIALILKALLGEKLTLFSSYSELKALTSQHDNLFMAFVVNTSSYEYVQLLKTWTGNNLPLALTTQTTALPLSHRPTFSFKALPIHIWSLLRSGDQWLKFNHGGMKDLDEEAKNLFNEKLFNFVDRLQYPIVAEYSAELEKELSVSNYHLVYMFPGVKKGLDLNTFAQTLARSTYTDFVFIIGKRKTEIADRLFVDKKKSQVVILPFASEEDMFAVDIETSDMKRETEHFRGILESVAHDHPRTEEGLLEETGPPLVSVLDTMFLQSIVEEKQSHVLVAFCEKGKPSCPGDVYEVLRNVMVALQADEIKGLITSLVAHVAECDSVEDIQSYGFKSLPAYGLYNFTRNKWTKMDKELTEPYQAMALLVLKTGIDALLELDLDSADDLDYTSSPFGYEDVVSSPLIDDDHFGIVLKTLPTVQLPRDLSLTSNNFDAHISQYEKTVVIFYMSWCPRSQVFLNHVAAAYEKLDKAQNGSVAVVSCDEWTDLCTRMNVLTYPTALLLTPHTLHTPTSLTSLDTPHILNALGQYPLDTDNQDKLMELTPSSLPSLLRGDLTTPLVIWCDKDVTSEKGVEFIQVALKLKDQSNLSFAWMDSSRYTDLLLKIIGNDQISFPTVVVLQMAERNVYQFSVKEGQTAQEFELGLETFLTAVANGDAQPSGSLGEKSWPPLQPPVTFPSLDYEDEAAEREPMGEGDPQSGDSPTNGAQLDTPTLPGGGDSPNGAKLHTEQSMHSEL